LAIPVFNEGSRVGAVLDAARAHVPGPILVVDDGSTDSTHRIVRARAVETVRHEHNRGYGAALQTAFRWAQERGIRWCVTMDADWQHEPEFIEHIAGRLRPEVDIVSGSRYLDTALARGAPPEDRRWVNTVITEMLKALTGYPITDAFCGFRAYRVQAMARLELKEPGYALPVELWIKAAHCGLAVEEFAVPLIYHDYGKGVGARKAHQRLAEYLSVAAEALLWTCS